MTLVAFFSEYLYFLSGLYFLFFWIVFYILIKKDTVARKQMLVMSLLFMVQVPFIEKITLIDWWQPNFVFDTYLHFEDFLFGFALAGTTSGLYATLKKRLHWQNSSTFSNTYKILVPLGAFIIFIGLFFLTPTNSFWSSVIALLFLNLVTATKIPSIIPLVSAVGILLTLLAIPGYFLGSFLNPGWIQQYWILDGWPGTLLLTVPIGEYIFYVLIGMTLAMTQAFLFAKESKS